MVQKRVTVHNSDGLHLRPASLLVSTSRRFKATVKLCKDAEQADTKSIFELLALAAACDCELVLSASGEDEAAAAEEIAELFADGGGI